MSKYEAAENTTQVQIPQNCTVLYCTVLLNVLKNMTFHQWWNQFSLNRIQLRKLQCSCCYVRFTSTLKKKFFIVQRFKLKVKEVISCLSSQKHIIGPTQTVFTINL